MASERTLSKEILTSLVVENAFDFIDEASHVGRVSDVC